MFEPAFHLAVPSFFLLLGSLATLLTGVADRPDIFPLSPRITERLRRKTWESPMSNLSRHFLLSESFRLLLDWPHNFHAFLDRYRLKGNDTYFSGFSREYKPIRGLLEALKGEEFAFVREAMDSYLIRWDGGIVRRDSRYIFSDSRSRRRYGGIQEAAHILRLPYSTTARLVKMGKLEAKWLFKGPRKTWLVEGKSVVLLQSQIKHHLKLREAEKELGISRKEAIEIIKSGMLSALYLTPATPMIALTTRS
jgi:hypothetical protein